MFAQRGWTHSSDFILALYYQKTKGLHKPSSHRRSWTCTWNNLVKSRAPSSYQNYHASISLLSLLIPLIPISTPSPPLSACSWENSTVAFRWALTLGSGSISLVSWHRTPPTTRWREGEDRTTREREQRKSEKERKRAIKKTGDTPRGRGGGRNRGEREKNAAISENWASTIWFELQE